LGSITTGDPKGKVVASPSKKRSEVKPDVKRIISSVQHFNSSRAAKYAKTPIKAEPCKAEESFDESKINEMKKFRVLSNNVRSMMSPRI
jgi:hypothetical protein